MANFTFLLAKVPKLTPFVYSFVLRAHNKSKISSKPVNPRNPLETNKANSLPYFIQNKFVYSTREFFASILRQDEEQGGKDTVSGWKPVYLTDQGDKVLPQKTLQK